MRSSTKRNEMLEAGESDVEIILSIKEGRGFEEVLQPTFLTGTLNGYSLDTNKVESCPNPQYEIDLIWETNKTTLRRMRSGQVPLKLECFAFKENGDKEKLGYVLLNIRSAQVMCQQRKSDVKASWHKLLGLRNDLKIHKPELLLTLKIEDKKSSNINSTVKIESSVTDINVQNDEISYLYSNEQLIQVGPPNTCYEYFLLSITIMSVEDLHLLLPEHLNKNGFVHFLYRILENDIKLKSIKTESGKCDSFYEKVVIKIRSSLNILKYYLQSKPHMLIFLKHENNILAESSVNLQSLVVADNFIEPLKCNISASTVYERCFLTKRDSIQKPNESQCEKCHLDLELKLLYIGNKVERDTVCNPDIIPFNNQIINSHNQENKNNANQKCQGIELYKTSNGNIEKFNSNHNFDERMHATECNNVNKQPVDYQYLNCQKDKITHLCDETICNCNNKNYIKNTGSYHCYCLHILIMAVTLVSSKFSKRQIEFRVHHPKAEIISTVHATMPVSTGETIKLHESGCQFHFISTSDEIKQLLNSFPPKISMHDTNKSEALSLLVLDLKSLFDQPEYQQNISVYDTDQNKICEMDIMFKLEDRGLHFILKKESSRKNLGPPILDDSLAYKIVDELETWKERQKEMFKFELKKKEERHLNILSEEWRKQKETLESKLACSVEQCKMLAASLNSATEDLKTRRLKSLENETRLMKVNEELQWRYEIKVQELKDSLHVMQADLTAKITKLEENKAALEAQLKVVMRENENLKLLMNKQIEELQMYQKGSLTQDQTTSLLQEVKLLEEKLENARKGKFFFKEQWAKAVREIHRMKVDYQQAMQVQIKNSKEELKNVELAEILSVDTKALNNDQILLNELQKEINIIKPRQYFASTESDNQIYTPTDNIFKTCNNTKILSHKSEEYNERLQALREERDSLLKTGSYAADDVVIKKLNTEIGALLVRK